MAFIKNAHLRPLHKCRIYRFLESSFYFSKFISRYILRIIWGSKFVTSAVVLVAAKLRTSPKSCPAGPIEKVSHLGTRTLKLVWFRYNLSDNHCGIISGIVSRHSLVKVHPKYWSVKWLKVSLTTFFDFLTLKLGNMSLNVPHILTFPDYPIDYPTFLVIILDKLLSHSITVWADLLQLKLNFSTRWKFRISSKISA